MKAKDKHGDTRYIWVVGMGVTWEVCNDCDQLLRVLEGYRTKKTREAEKDEA